MPLNKATKSYILGATFTNIIILRLASFFALASAGGL